LDGSHQLLAKRSYKSARENLDAIYAGSANIAVEQEVIVAASMIALFIFRRF